MTSFLSALVLTVVALISLVMSWPPGSAAQDSPGEHCTGSSGSVSLYITDFGINQWKPGLKLGDDFERASAHVFSQLPLAGQILVPMPNDAEFDRTSPSERTNAFAHAIRSRVDAGLKQGVTTFEIQLVQHIAHGGYVTPERQRQADEFGVAAYRAIGEVVGQLKDRGMTLFTYAIVGSNGTKVFTENVQAWASYLQGASLYDGRAFLGPTANAIRVLGPDRVNLFNTLGDWAAPHNPFSKSIGNFETAKDLKRMFPGLGVHLLDPVDRPNLPFFSHLAGMHENGRFKVSTYDGRSLGIARPATGRDYLPLVDVPRDGTKPRSIVQPVGGICLGKEQKYRTNPNLDREIDRMTETTTR